MEQAPSLPSSVRVEDLFRGVSAATRRAFERLEERSSHPQGTVLFTREGLAAGIYVLRSGSVGLASVPLHKQLEPLVVAQPGEILGVSAALAGTPYGVAAEVREAATVGFVARHTLLKFLREHSDVAYRLVELLSDAIKSTLDLRRWLPAGGDVSH
jgi:CRP/FNR family transcriptional regulator, cyclic AMP receptor protein